MEWVRKNVSCLYGLIGFFFQATNIRIPEILESLNEVKIGTKNKNFRLDLLSKLLWLCNNYTTNTNETYIVR